MQPVSSGLISFLLHFESGPANPKAGGGERNITGKLVLD